jgi:HlyD family secretion protein
LATLQEAAEKYERLRQLDMRGVTTHTEFTAAKAAYLRAQADALIAKADLALAEANLALQKAELQKACICSPINGVVLKRAAEVGQIVASSLSAPILFTIAEDLTKMELQVDIDEADIGRINLGDPAEFTVEAYENRHFPARITHIRYASETIDGVVTYKALLSIENVDMALRPGMTATTEITVASLQDVLLVPNAALRFAPPQTAAEDDREGGSGLLGMIFSNAPRDTSTTQRLQKTVWVLADGIAREVLVSGGSTNGLQTVMEGSDLKPGDLVITDQFGDD